MNKSSRITVRVDEEQLKEIEQSGQKKSEYIREAVSFYQRNIIRKHEETVRQNENTIRHLSDVRDTIVRQIEELEKENTTEKQKIKEIQEIQKNTKTTQEDITKAIQNVQHIIERVGGVTEEQLRFNAKEINMRLDMFKEILKDAGVKYKKK